MRIFGGLCAFGICSGVPLCLGAFVLSTAICNEIAMQEGIKKCIKCVLNRRAKQQRLRAKKALKIQKPH